MRYNGSGVLLSHLTSLEPKGKRVLELVRVWKFQWYFTLETSFSGILRFCGSLSAIKPIFPSIFCLDEEGRDDLFSDESLTCRAHYSNFFLFFLFPFSFLFSSSLSFLLRSLPS